MEILANAKGITQFERALMSIHTECVCVPVHRKQWYHLVARSQMKSQTLSVKETCRPFKFSLNEFRTNWCSKR